MQVARPAYKFPTPYNLSHKLLDDAFADVSDFINQAISENDSIT